MSSRMKVGFVSLGCPKNLVDTENMITRLSEGDVIITHSESDADVVVVNTCAFLEPAKDESMSTIKEFAEMKDSGQLKGLVVAGCMTERYLGPMKESFPQVDAFIRTGEFSKIREVIDQIQSGSPSLKTELLGEAEQLQGHSEMSDFNLRMKSNRSYAYVKISEGCNRVCSFCIIPKLRGKHHSRSIPGIVDEVSQLVHSGTPEIVFIAQDLTSYGKDLKNGSSLLALLKEVEKLPETFWYRLMYNYPRFFDDELIDFLASSEKFSGYLDIPFQHSSDSVLKAMKRPESADQIRELIWKLRDRIPHLSLRTTLMVGFPGETDEDFKNLLEFVEESHFEHMGAFKFYREKDTPSYDLPNQVSEELKEARYRELMLKQAEVQARILDSRVGQTLDVLIEGVSEETKDGRLYRGRHYGQAPEIDGVTYVISPESLEVGDVVAVNLQRRFGEYDLLGETQIEELQCYSSN